jgi:hypothetical protein
MSSTATASPDAKGWARRTVEKIRTAYLAGRFHLLPWLDVLTEETAEIRGHYRVMMREPVLQAAVKGQVLSVAAQEVQVHSDEAEDPDDPRQVAIRKAVKYALSKVHSGHLSLPLSTGPRHIAWSILSGALIDGWSLCEQTYKSQPERKGPCAGKLLWESFKSKDVQHLQLVTDRFWNVEGIRAPRFNPGAVFTGEDLQSFVIYSHHPLFANPIGMSAFRSAYRAFWIKDTAWKLRSLHLDKFTTPALKGTYATLDQKAALEEAMEEFRGATWISVPAGSLVDALDVSGKGTAEYKSAIADCDQEMLTAVCGAYLHMMTSQTPNARGDSEVQKETTELFQWALSASLGDVVTTQMVRPWVLLNYHDVEPPTVTWGAVSEAAMEARARVDKMLQDLGMELSEKEARTYYGRQMPAGPDDVLKPKGQGGAPPPGGGGGLAGSPPGPPGETPPDDAAPGGGGGGQQDWSPFGEKKDSLGRRICWEDQTGKRVPCSPAGQERKVGHVPQIGDDDVRSTGFKPPYKTPLGVQLHKVADWSAAHPGAGHAAGTAAHDAVRHRADALARWAVDEYGTEAKGLDSYREFRRVAERARDQAYETVANGTDAAVMKKTLTRLSQDVGLAFMWVRDELAAREQTSLEASWETPPPDEEDARLFPAEGHVREGADSHGEDLPPQMRPISYQGLTLTHQGQPLSTAQQKAVADYTDKGYRAVNDMLRGADDPTPRAQKLHAQLQTLFAAAAPSEKPVTVYRGLSLHSQQVVRLLKQLKGAHESGEAVHFAGYSSTSFDPAIAFTYGEGGKRKAGGSGNDVVFEIAARKGVNLGVLASDDPSGQLSEQELLLDHDSAFRVAGIRTVKFKHPETGEVQERAVVQLVQEV